MILAATVGSTGALHTEARQFVHRIGEWAASFPPGVVELVRLPIPDDDDYGLAASLALRPMRDGGCPKELGITIPEKGSATCIFLDSWAAIAHRNGLAVGQGNSKLVALYLEPVGLRLDTVLDVSRQIAAGAVHLYAVTLGRRLVGTAGFVPHSEGPLLMRGNGIPLPLARAAEKVRVLRTWRIQYDSWR